MLRSALKALVDELLLYETVCNHGSKIRFFFEMAMGVEGFFLMPGSKTAWNGGCSGDCSGD